VRELCRCRRRDKVEIAYTLLELKERGLLDVLGYAGLGHYGSEVEGLHPSTTSELVKVAAKLSKGALPKIRAAFDSGRLAANKAAVLVDVATPETEEEWLEQADRLDPTGLRSLAEGGEAKRRVQGYVLLSLLVWIHEGVRVVRETGGPTEFWAALAELCRRYVKGEALGLKKEPGSRRGVRPLLVLRQGADGGFTRETPLGPVPADEETVAWARREGKVYDLSQGPPEVPETREGEEVKRAIPQAVRDYVDARDGDRCIFPGCLHCCFLEADHFDGWKNGHDPRRIGKLCTAHHALRGRGYFRVETGDDDVMRFFLHDGTFVGVAGAREREDGRKADQGEQPEFVRAKREDPQPEFVRAKREDRPPEVVSAKPSGQEDALKALVVMGLKKREAKAMLARTLALWPELAEAEAGVILHAALGGRGTGE
jgi:hypothetical protein